MCNQTALYATPQQITRLVSTKLHLKQCKLTDKKLFFIIIIFEDTVCCDSSIVADAHI